MTEVPLNRGKCLGGRELEYSFVREDLSKSTITEVHQTLSVCASKGTLEA